MGSRKSSFPRVASGHRAQAVRLGGKGLRQLSNRVFSRGIGTVLGTAPMSHPVTAPSRHSALRGLSPCPRQAISSLPRPSPRVLSTHLAPTN